MLSFHDVLLGLLLPAVVCAAMLLAAWQPWHRDISARRDGRWAGAIAIGGAYAIAYAQLVGGCRFPPADPDNWIVYLMPVAMIAGVLFCQLPPSPWLRLAVIAVVCTLLTWLLLKPRIGSDFSAGAAAAWIAGCSIFMILWWILLNQLARRGPRMLAPLAIFVAAAGAAVVLGDSGLAQRGGFTMGALAVILAAVLCVAAVTPSFSLAGGAMLTITIAFFGTLIYGYFYIYPDPTPRLTAAMVTVLVSPILAWVAWLPWVRRRSPWQRGAVGAVSALLGVAAAVSLVELSSGVAP